MQGDQMLFTRADEVEAQWRVVAPILEAWASGDPADLATYPAGSEGPAEAARLPERSGHAWRELTRTDEGVSVGGAEA
jgi:glucose-6-phosphate 1-dehydrogenase